MNSEFVLLLLEDSEEDIFLFRRAISKVGRSVALQSVRDGISAQQYLRGEDKFTNRAEFPMPAVIFSDLQLAGMGGLQFLDWLRHQSLLRALPCVIYSGSANPADVQAAYELGVTSFIVKPIDFTEWVARLEVVLKFWMDIAQHPPIELSVGGIEHSEKFAKTLFVQFANARDAQQLSDAFVAASPSQKNYEFNAHLSLLYAHLPAETKAAEARNIRAPFERVLFDSIAAIRFPRPIESRADVESWRTIATAKLAR